MADGRCNCSAAVLFGRAGEVQLRAYRMHAGHFASRTFFVPAIQVLRWAEFRDHRPFACSGGRGSPDGGAHRVALAY